MLQKFPLLLIIFINSSTLSVTEIKYARALYPLSVFLKKKNPQNPVFYMYWGSSIWVSLIWVISIWQRCYLCFSQIDRKLDIFPILQGLAKFLEYRADSPFLGSHIHNQTFWFSTKILKRCTFFEHRQAQTWKLRSCCKSGDLDINNFPKI